MEDLNEAILNLFLSHRRIKHEAFSKYDITRGQPMVLNYIAAHEGCMQRELAEHCHIEAASMTSILSVMEKRGLILRTRNPESKRIINVTLTEKGKLAQQQVVKTINEINEISFRGFSEEEQKETIRTLKRIQENIDRRAAEND